MDEFYRLFLKDSSSLPFKVKVIIVPEDIKAILKAVSRTQTSTVSPSEPSDSHVYRFDNVNELIKHIESLPK